MYFVLLPAKGNEEILRKLRKTQFWAFFAIFDKSEFFRYVSKEKKFTERKIRRKQGDKADREFEGHCTSSQWG